MKIKISVLKDRAMAALATVADEAGLKNWHQQYLGRKGQLISLFDELKNLAAADKRLAGPLLNDLKKHLNRFYHEKERAILGRADSAILDATIPGLAPSLGHLHPITQIRWAVEDIFRSMGFTVHEGPEIENDYYNFEALNIPADHPARESMDTFWLKDKDAHGRPLLLRTHTSATQARLLANHQPPIRAIVPGKCFRHEATDASHEHTFYQIEGLVVDRDISIANLSDTLRAFLSVLFNADVKIRLRPGYFPFVEPGFELDFQCVICRGQGCSVCKRTGWVELIPCGMVHPKVFAHAGYKKDAFTGFAFAMGLDRVAMMKYGIDDIRYFHAGDLRFLEQF